MHSGPLGDESNSWHAEREKKEWLLLLEELLMYVCFMYCAVMNVMMQLVLTELVQFILMKLVILDIGGYNRNDQPCVTINVRLFYSSVNLFLLKNNQNSMPH